MPFLHNTQSGSVVGELASDDPMYRYLAEMRDANDRPVWEDIGVQEVSTLLGADESSTFAETLQVRVNAVAANANFSIVVGRPQYDGIVTKVEYFPLVAVVGAAAPNSRTLELVNAGQGGAGTTAAATLALVANTDLNANQSNNIPVTANNAVVANDELQWESNANDATAGLADPGGLVVVTLHRS